MCDIKVDTGQCHLRNKTISLFLIDAEVIISSFICMYSYILKYCIKFTSCKYLSFELKWNELFLGPGSQGNFCCENITNRTKSAKFVMVKIVLLFYILFILFEIAFYWFIKKTLNNAETLRIVTPTYRCTSALKSTRHEMYVLIVPLETIIKPLLNLLLEEGK